MVLRTCVNRDAIPISQQADWPVARRFGTDVANTHPTGSSREATIRDERDLFAIPLAINQRGNSEHLSHAGSATRAFVSDDNHITGRVRLPAHGRKTVLFRFKDPCGTLVLQLL